MEVSLSESSSAFYRSVRLVNQFGMQCTKGSIVYGLGSGVEAGTSRTIFLSPFDGQFHRADSLRELDLLVSHPCGLGCREV